MKKVISLRNPHPHETCYKCGGKITHPEQPPNRCEYVLDCPQCRTLHTYLAIVDYGKFPPNVEEIICVKVETVPPIANVVAFYTEGENGWGKGSPFHLVFFPERRWTKQDFQDVLDSHHYPLDFMELIGWTDPRNLYVQGVDIQTPDTIHITQSLERAYDITREINFK